MLARAAVIAFLLAVPAAHGADLAIRAVVKKTVRVSTQGVAVQTPRHAEPVQVTVQPAAEGGMLLVFTP